MVVNWNNWQDTIECLESVLRSTHRNFRVFVCDNGSADESLTQMIGWAEGRLNIWNATSNPLKPFSWPPMPKPVPYFYVSEESAQYKQPLPTPSVPYVAFFRTEDNRGFAAGNNIVLRWITKHSEAEYVWLLNNDCVVDPRAMKGMLDYSIARSELSAIGSLLLHYENPTIIQGAGGSYNEWLGHVSHLYAGKSADGEISLPKIDRCIKFIMGASIFTKRAVFERVGLLSEDYFLFFEELDFFRRFQPAPKLSCALNSRVFHKGGASTRPRTSTGRDEIIPDYYFTRGKLIFAKRFCPSTLASVFIISFIFALRLMLRGNVRRGTYIIRVLLGIEPPPIARTTRPRRS